MQAAHVVNATAARRGSWEPRWQVRWRDEQGAASLPAATVPGFSSTLFSALLCSCCTVPACFLHLGSNLFFSIFHMCFC
jgi:hypothetical protein